MAITANVPDNRQSADRAWARLAGGRLEATAGDGSTHTEPPEPEPEPLPEPLSRADGGETVKLGMYMDLSWSFRDKASSETTKNLDTNISRELSPSTCDK